MKSIFVGGTEVPVKATGFTTILFKRFTGTDLMSVLSDKGREAEKINDVLALFYCMSVQAQEEKIGEMLNRVSDVTDYYEFLNRFNSQALYSQEVLTAVITTWVSSSEQSSKAKNG
jgi:hypothetical protein